MTRSLKASTKVQVAAAGQQAARKRKKEEEKNGIQSRAKRNNFEREKRLLEKAWKSGFSAYGLRQNLQKATKLTAKKVDDFLQGINSHTKFFIPQRRSYPQLRTLAFDINDIWCMDIAYVDKIAMPNDGVKFLLVCEDVLSRYLRVEPLKRLTSVNVKYSLVAMLNECPTVHPYKIWTDQGREFDGNFRKFCKTVGINQYNSFNVTKAAFAERVIRAL